MADGFNLDSFSKQLEEQRVRTEARQAAATQTQERQAEIRQRSTAVAGQYAKDVGFLRDSVAVSQQKADHARQLADSNNPMDTLRLMGLQMMDPGGYDRSTRSARLAEDMQRAAALGNYYGIQQQALESELLSSSTELDRAKLAEEIGMERLTLLQDQAAMTAQNMAASRTMQQAALSQLDSAGVAAALAQAKLSPNRQVNVGGIDIGLTELEDRNKALVEREHQMRLFGALAGMREEEVLAAETEAKVAGRNRRMTEQELSYEDSDLRNSRLKRQLDNQKLFDETQQRYLSTMNGEELLGIRTNGYKDAAGNQLNPVDVDAAYSRVKTAEADAIQAQMQKQAFGQFDVDMLAGQKARVDSIVPRLPVNSPAARAAREFQSVIGLTGNHVGPDVPTSQKALAISAFQMAEEKFEKAIAAQAKFEAGRDSKKEQMLVEFYRGNDVPLEQIHDSIRERLENRRTVADLVPPQIASQIESIYNRRLSEMRQAGGQFGGSISATDGKIMQAEAARMAVESVVQSQVQEQAQEILTNQVLFPSHPLHGKLSPTQFGNYMLTADKRAAERVKSEFGLNDESLNAVEQGIEVKGIDEAKAMQIRTLLRAAQNGEFLMSLESLQPGLGREVAEWWQGEGSNYTKAQHEMKRAQGGTFGEAIVNGLQGDYMVNAMATYGAGLYESEQSTKSEMARRNAELMTFGSDPEQAQVVMLNGAKDLESSEKAQLWKEVFTPLLAEAASRGLDFKKTNEFIEQSIMGDFPDASPATKSLLKTLRRTRPDVAKQINNLQGWGKWFFGSRFQGQAAPEYMDWYDGSRGKDLFK